MTNVQQRRRRLTRRRLAQVVTEVCAPVVLSIGLLLIVGAASTPNPLVGLGWGLLAAFFVGVIPYGFLLLGIRRGRWTDRHVRIREQRTVPLAFAIASVVFGAGVLAVAGAPQQLIALVIAGLAGLAVTVVLTLAWKISIHTAVASGTATILFLVFGPALLLTWPLVAAVGWSRMELRDHSPAQVIAGAVVGTLVAAAVFTTLR